MPACLKSVFNDWLDYKNSRKESYKSEKSIKAAYNKLVKLSDNNPIEANKIILQSMSNNWAGLFKLNNDEKNRTNNRNSFESDTTKGAIEGAISRLRGEA